MPPKITDISITRSPVMLGQFCLQVEWGDLRYTGYFEDMGGFITAVSECGRFYAVRSGLLRAKDAKLTRPVVPGDGRIVLPGDRTA